MMAPTTRISIKPPWPEDPEMVTTECLGVKDEFDPDGTEDVTVAMPVVLLAPVRAHVQGGHVSGASAVLVVWVDSKTVIVSVAWPGDPLGAVVSEGPRVIVDVVVDVIWVDSTTVMISVSVVDTTGALLTVAKLEAPTVVVVTVDTGSVTVSMELNDSSVDVAVSVGTRDIDSGWLLVEAVVHVLVLMGISVIDSGRLATLVVPVNVSVRIGPLETV